MTQANAKVTKLNRVERNAWTKQKIFDAATKVVGKHGYAEASVARITEEAGVAQGTFYNHFENRQELLDQLLPKIGLDMVEFIRARTGTADAARQEIARFSAFFDFIREVPEFLRILNEAEYFAPIGYQKHLDNIATAYVRILRRARECAVEDADGIRVPSGIALQLGQVGEEVDAIGRTCDGPRHQVDAAARIAQLRDSHA